MNVPMREAAKWARTLHIYFSLLGLTGFLFFAVTGIMLTHDSFGQDQMTAETRQISLPVEAAKYGGQNRIVKLLQSSGSITLPLVNYAEDSDQIEATFAGPGQRTQVRINREDGSTELVLESRGWIGIIADLHKGAETGWIWRLIMDIVSAWLILSTITGLWMLMTLPKRRMLGLILAAAATIASALAYVFVVPR